MKNPPDPFFTFGPAVTAVGAATVAGVALWLSRASFDVAGTTAAPVRVAMLPSLAELMGFVALALLIAAGLAVLLRHRRDREQTFWERATDALLPLFALSLLVLPYLPWLADWIPALRLLRRARTYPDLGCRCRPGALGISSSARDVATVSKRRSGRYYGAAFASSPLPERAVRAQRARNFRLRLSICFRSVAAAAVGHVVSGADGQSRRAVRSGIRHPVAFAPVLLLAFHRARRHVARARASSSGDRVGRQ